MMSDALTGGCLCGEIRFVVECAVDRLVACYCSDCQRMTSSGGSTNALVPASAFRLVRGQTRVFSKVADSGNTLDRHFCGNCGSWIYNPKGDDPEFVVLKAGTFDRHDGMTIRLNLWARSRPPWAPMDATITTRETQ